MCSQINQNSEHIKMLWWLEDEHIDNIIKQQTEATPGMNNYDQSMVGASIKDHEARS